MIQKKRIIILIGIILVVLNIGTLQAMRKNLVREKRRFGLNISLALDMEDNSALLLNADFFISRRLSISAGMGSEFSVQAAVRYYLLNHNITPYLGLQMVAITKNFQFATGGSTENYAGLEVGIHLFTRAIVDLRASILFSENPLLQIGIGLRL